MSTPVYKFLPKTDQHMPARGIAASGETTRSSGWDVCAYLPEPLVLSPGDSALIPLGVQAICPDGWWLQLHPRSSTFAKKHLISLVGVIDHDYEGTIMLAVKYMPPTPVPLTIQPGEKIAQLIPQKLEEMEVQQLTEAEFAATAAARRGSRGAGGFGSTGN